MVPRVITLAIGLFFGPYVQSPHFANQAIARVRQLSVSHLDSGLGEGSFDSWLLQVVGPRAGITWQLSECGEKGAASDAEIQACVEVSAILPDERKVVVMTWVGSFKKGLYGEPKLIFAVVEQDGEFFEASHLGELPQILRRPILRSLVRRPDSSTPAPPNIVLPVSDRVFSVADQPLPGRDLLPSSELPAESMIVASVEESPAAIEPRRISEGVLLGSVSARVLPSYPQHAKQLHVSGEVKVDITINEEGRVVEARAISGPVPLRLSAEEAARKWVFKPTLLNHERVSVRGILTFIFSMP